METTIFIGFIAVCLIALVYAFVKLGQGLNMRKQILDLYKTPDTVSYTEIRSESSLNELQKALKPKVLANLKSPGSAVLCPPSEMSIERKDGNFIVKGYVDSQNEFGAMKRAKFNAKCAYDAECKFWLCVSIFLYE